MTEGLQKAGFTLDPERFDRALAVLRMNIGDGASLSFSDLPRLKVPAGGGLFFSVERAEGVVPQKEIEAVLLYLGARRAYWQKPVGEGEDTPPDCKSHDGLVGVGNPGGDCLACPLAQWGSFKEGSRRVACRETRLAYMLVQGSILPTALIVPPSSLGPLRKYALRLANEEIAYNEVVTAISLAPASSEGGIGYSQLTFSMKRQLAADEAALVGGYAGIIEPILERERQGGFEVDHA